MEVAKTSSQLTTIQSAAHSEPRMNLFIDPAEVSFHPHFLLSHFFKTVLVLAFFVVATLDESKGLTGLSRDGIGRAYK